MLYPNLRLLKRQFALMTSMMLFAVAFSFAQATDTRHLNADGEDMALQLANQEFLLDQKPAKDIQSGEKSGTNDCIELPPYQRTFTSSGLSRGFWFTAQSDFVINSLRVPNEDGGNAQSIQVVRMPAAPPEFSDGRTTATTLFYVQNATDDYIAVEIPVSSGDVIGILGVRGPGFAKSSYASDGPKIIDIAGVPTTATRFGVQQNINNGEATGNVFWQEVEFNFSRIEVCTAPLISEIGCTGSSDYDDVSDTYTVTSDNCYYANPFTSDQLIMDGEELCGDGEIIAQVTGITGIGWAGITLRETEDVGSKKVQLSTNGSSLARREIRTMTNGPAYPQQFPAFGKRWLRLVRSGFQIYGYISNNGFVWQQVLVSNVSMNECISAGLIVTGFNPNFSTTATFSNVSISGPAPLVADHNSEDQFAGFSIDNQLDESSIELYPNPVTEVLNIRLNQDLDQATGLELMDANGQVVKSAQLNGSLQLNVSDLPRGIYMLRIQSAQDAPILKRVIVQ